MDKSASEIILRHDSNIPAAITVFRAFQSTVFCSLVYPRPVKFPGGMPGCQWVAGGQVWVPGRPFPDMKGTIGRPVSANVSENKLGT